MNPKPSPPVLQIPILHYMYEIDYGVETEVIFLRNRSCTPTAAVSEQVQREVIFLRNRLCTPTQSISRPVRVSGRYGHLRVQGKELHKV